MATKKEKTAIKSAVTREKKRGIVREEKHILWILLAIIFVLLYLLLAQSYGWWPYVQPKLGSAFYTNVAANAPADASKTTTSTGKSSTSTSKNTSSGSNTGSSGSGSNSGGTSGGGSTTPTTGSGSIADLAANVNVGDTKTKIGAKANNLGSGCAVVVNANTQTVLGKQEVCTYSQGDKIVTVTYLNNRVISASKSGF
jgi:cytoskeletal protein RodZ